MKKWLILTGILIFSLAQTALAQKLTNLNIIKKTIAAAGGDTWRRPQTLQLTGTATLYQQGQAENGNQMTIYKMWRIFPAANTEAHKANGKVRFDAFSGDKMFFQITFDGERSVNNLSDEANKQADNFKWDNAFGFLILRFADGADFELTRMADDQIEGFPCYFIRVVDPKKNETVFGIDKQNFYVRSVAFDTPIGFHQRIYSDFKWNKKPRFLQPTHVRLYYKGVKTADIHWLLFKVNQPIEDNIFALTAK